MAVTAPSASMIALRLPEGEDVCPALLREFDRLGARGAAVVAAIGSLEHLQYAVVGQAEDGTPCYVNRELNEPTEVASLQGHLGRKGNGDADFHLHGVFAPRDGRIVGGHVFGARVLLTLEVTMIVGDGLEWEVRPFVPRGMQRDPGMSVFVPTHAVAGTGD
jgi:predicted DNA-binding protein with PD1-like motif